MKFIVLWWVLVIEAFSLYVTVTYKSDVEEGNNLTSRD